jgi:hypothetical protein
MIGIRVLYLIESSMSLVPRKLLSQGRNILELEDIFSPGHFLIRVLSLIIEDQPITEISNMMTIRPGPKGHLNNFSKSLNKYINSNNEETPMSLRQFVNIFVIAFQGISSLPRIVESLACSFKSRESRITIVSSWFRLRWSSKLQIEYPRRRPRNKHRY